MRTLFILLFTFSFLIVKADFWTQKANYPGGARIFSVGFSIGNKGYIGTGFDLFGDTSAFWEFDPGLNIWNQKTNFLGMMRETAVSFVIGNKGYVCTGGDYDNFIDHVDLWAYDPALNSWTQKADFGGSGRGSAAGFALLGKGYVGTGVDQSATQFKDFWEYDPVSNNWTQKADFGGLEHYLGTGFAIGTKGYICVGTDHSLWPLGNNELWEYDPILDLWSQKANFGGIGRTEICSFVLCNNGYVGTGTTRIGNFNEARSDFWKYDATTDTWTQVASFSGGVREGAVGFAIANKGYVGTGFANDNFNFIEDDFWEYTPDGLCPTGLEDLQDNYLKFSIWPNPAIDKLLISFYSLPKSTVSVIIKNSLGEKIFSLHDQNMLSDLQIPVANFQSGIYFVEVSDGKNETLRKFVKL
ncbi:MAG: T9SS type A sorting domain-containing protein [Bacteroidia bacterium]|nr:T9SS type A sorting domain-containing protein [Bacteroidota bacterium]MBK9422836.1 T9SS type A sorting domain-containing protein [Bacteroidota bacterium]MBP9081591.1 T9SS type A sorting domain-containing protein [Bacteroidia bacterium]